MWKYICDIYNGKSSETTDVIDITAKDRYIRLDNTYEIMETIDIKDENIPDLNGRQIYLVKYRTQMPMDQIIGVCESMKDSTGNEIMTNDQLVISDQNYKDMRIMKKMYKLFKTDVMGRGMMMCRNSSERREVDVVMYGIMIKNEDGKIEKYWN